VAARPDAAVTDVNSEEEKLSVNCSALGAFEEVMPEMERFIGTNEPGTPETDARLKVGCDKPTEGRSRPKKISPTGR